MRLRLLFVPSIAVPSRPPRSFWISQIYRSSGPPPPLSLVPTSPMMRRMHSIMASYACSESTSASLRPKEFPPSLQRRFICCLLQKRFLFGVFGFLPVGWASTSRSKVSRKGEDLRGGQSMVLYRRMKKNPKSQTKTSPPVQHICAASR